ncbi:hypothetical protein ACIBH1_34010 [Nonomuraea sp. NPDC050663]|uniref:Uncharacterized protein n=1 Tax=Nonomuraea soli TaxID=1032476 RepID=A0A7W0HV65_9ACTN|nr:hypothetical protein [Nonomuraea soli]MBA2896903.1 hypothetical protein [Nonomuraea soli]NUT44312.1 hypothetical protein [Thermoactinospora sp.]
MSEEHDQTIRYRRPTPGQPAQPPEPPQTVRLPYTPDLFPDVAHVEAKPPRSAWWWVVVASVLLAVVAAAAIAIVLWSTGG